MKKLILVLSLVLNAGIMGVSAQDMQAEIAMIKKNLIDSREKMKTYEWIETTTIFVKDEPKSSSEKRCYYDVNGKITKVETGGSKAKLHGGLSKGKKEKVVEYAEAAVAKIHTYLPPKPEKIQAVHAAGKASIQILEPKKRFMLNFPDYNEAGDKLSISIDRPAQRITALDIITSVNKEKSVFNVTYSNLPDGTQYVGKATLKAPEKNLKIVITNSGIKSK